MTLQELTALIRDVPDFPRPGILFKDITPLLGHADAFAQSCELLVERVAPHRPDALVGIESRGFLFAAGMAALMRLPIQLTRKTGKLPYRTVAVSYALEYGTDCVEMHIDAIERGKRYVVVDDLIATGGTASATAQLIEGQGGIVTCLAFVIELAFLQGAARLDGRTVEALLRF